MMERVMAQPNYRLTLLATFFQRLQKATEETPNALQATYPQNAMYDVSPSAFDTVTPIIDVSTARRGSKGI